MMLLFAVCAALAEPLPGTFSVAPDPRDTVQQTRSQERDVLDELAQIDQDLAGIAAEVVSLQERRDDLEQRQRSLREDLAAAEGDLQEHRDAIAGWVRALYYLHRQGLARIIFGAEDPADLRRRSTYLLAIIAADAQRFDDFRAATAKRQAALSNLEGGIADINALGAELQLKEAELKEQRGRKMELLNEIRSRRELALSVMQEMNRSRTSFGGSGGGSWSGWGGGQQDSRPANNNGGGGNTWGGLDDAWSGSAQPRCNNAGSFQAARGQLPWPSDGQLVRGMGTYTDPQTGQRERSSGLYISNRVGAPVYAVYGGTVDIAEYLRGYGYTVAIQHGAYSTVYAQLNGLRVRKGQEICPGDLIGNVGESGYTQAGQGMLLFEIRYHKTPQDPMTWLEDR